MLFFFPVHQLHPSDIKIVAAMGDAFTVSSARFAILILMIVIEVNRLLNNNYYISQRSKMPPFWSPWRVEKKFGDQNSGDSRVMATILQLKVTF